MVDPGHATTPATLPRTPLPLRKALAPPAVVLVLLLLPAPEGLPPHAWRYLAIFAGLVVGLVLEPIPSAAIAFISVVTVALTARWTLLGPDALAAPGFRPEAAALDWALSGFSNGTVWLIWGAFMFALGYERTGLGRRLALRLIEKTRGRPLALGYAIAVADLLLAPFTPSNTARSGGTVFPVVRQLPPLFDSHPFHPSSRLIGGYLLWVTVAAMCVTSSMFLTGLATNLLAVELVASTTGIRLGWMQWLVGFAPVGLLLFPVVPLLAYVCYRPQVARGRDVVTWSQTQLEVLGPVQRQEVMLMVLVAGALACWVAAGAWIAPTLVALTVVSLMLLTGILTWHDVLGHRAAWSTLVWFATLIAMADGLNRAGVLTWSSGVVSAHVGGLDPMPATIALVSAFFLVHYLFASSTAHVTALLPATLVVASGIPGIDMTRVALLLCYTLGLMGIITPYATGPSPIYFGSGYLPARDYWRLGAIFGAVFLAVLLAVGVPWVFFVV
jgi:L-tartrate/succinate antiporter